MEFNLARIESETFVRQVFYQAEMTSTSDVARQLVHEQSGREPILVLTERQTAGRGRGANRWWAADGSLTFSLILDVSGRDPMTSRLSLQTGLAIAEALARWTEEAPVQVKWPNDVYVCEKKISGILIEKPAEASGRVIVGIGVNINNSLEHAPDELRANATSLIQVIGRATPVEDVLVRLLQTLAEQLAPERLNSPGLAAMWQEHCLLSGRHVELQVGGRSVVGHCLGIDDDGALLLETADGVQAFHSGTVR